MSEGADERDETVDDGPYTPAQRAIQDASETRRLADRLAMIAADHLREADVEFVTSRDFFFLSTVDEFGDPTVSYKGGPVGVVQVDDPTTLVFPDYDGNGMYVSLGNLTATGRIGLLFIDFESPHRLRVQATARISEDPDLVARWPGAQRAVVAEVHRVFTNCARYIHPHQRVRTAPHVPDDDGIAPFARWKRLDLVQDALRPADQGKADEHGGTISVDEYRASVDDGTS